MINYKKTDLKRLENVNCSYIIYGKDSHTTSQSLNGLICFDRHVELHEVLEILGGPSLRMILRPSGTISETIRHIKKCKSEEYIERGKEGNFPPPSKFPSMPKLPST